MPSGPRWYEASATLCGENTAMLLVRDVTERRQAEFRLWEANAALEQRTIQLRALASELTLAEQRVRRRLAELLHDHLQQLLVGATLRLPFLERAKEAPVRRAAAELHDLLKQSLECSRSLTGELSPPILHQGGLVPALKWLANWMQEKHGLSVALRAGRGVVLEAQDLTILLFQSIRELLFNAAKYAQVKTVDVELERSGAFIKAVVADQGIGFDPASLRATGGTASGFGLYAIRERLDLMGGRLEIASAPGQGSRFTLWVPVHDAPDREPSAAVAAPATAEPPAAPGLPPAAGTVQRKIRVLLVDDHSVVRQALAHLLGEEPDLDIVGEAADGPAAIAQVRRLLPDVVTMDVSMPGMNGIEATRIIHAEFPALRIIGLSLFTETERAEEMRRAGAAEYLTKSGPADALLAAIRGVHGPNHSR
jgi:CheY-like chemotaxis protein